ncbi:MULTISPECIES: hypothetical protein [unclassified Streptomyces]|uniref:hypothetical protein n=1 Tax=unclassified Streptomyces TaxID=2593676 RepID=UPI002E1F85E6|nr:hypothetical protein OG217_05890 [Streptomyces sp. NBC_01023]
MPALPLSLAAMCDLACETSLLPRVRMAIAVIAQEVFREDPATPGYPLRWNVARTALSPSTDQAAQMAPGLIVAPALLAAAASAGSSAPAAMAGAITDEQILDAIRQGWNAVAGVSPSAASGDQPQDGT